MFRNLLNGAFLSAAFVVFFWPYTQTGSKPVVEWLTPREHDFGTLRHERPAEYVFKFKNIATEPLILQTVRTTCGCTAASWTETPIAPGATGEVRIEYDAYLRGDFSKKIKVFFDKQRKAEVLRISGTVD